MAPNDKNMDKNDKKMPVLDATFRMAVEKVVQKFQESADKSFEFPSKLNKDQRQFVEKYLFKCGLKSKIEGKAHDMKVVACKEDPENLFTANSKIELKTRSKNIILKMLEMTKEGSNETESNNQNLATNLVSIGSVSRFGNNVITIPPMNSNPMFTKSRAQLPIYEHRNRILNLIGSNQVVVIESSTGSGKSTQLPQYLLEQSAENNEPCRIIVAEPKRICAVSLADRVSAERGEKLGASVGYQIRLESKVSPTSNLIYVTNGVILRMLMSGRPEEFFCGITALIIDEVHERDKFSDLLLLCIREYLHLNSKLRVIIMSATVDCTIFQNYFNNCPVLKLTGKIYPVTELFLEDLLNLLNFNSDKAQELRNAFKNNPRMFDKTKKPDDSNNMDDDTKDSVNEILNKIIEKGDDSYSEFLSFFYMVNAHHAPVDYRHMKSNKTVLMYAVEFGFTEHIKKLLTLGADPTLTAEIDSLEMNAVNVAVQTGNHKIAEMLMTHISLMNGAQVESTETTSPFNRALLNAYYDTLVQPGINRGVFLEDAVDLEIVVRLVRRLHTSRPYEEAILVFLPGYDEIVQLAALLYNALGSDYNIFILHSQMQTADQIHVFGAMPEGTRKIVIATNLAETSITINDVVHVIDSGKEKQKDYNSSSHVSSLRSQWISKASAKQRMGRAGRLRSGTVYRLYSRDRYNFLAESQKPEMLRCELTDICLQVKMIAPHDTSINSFLAKSLSPPSTMNVDHSIKILQDLGALNMNQSLTQLGFHLADIPLNAKYGKMLIYGIFFKCIDPILTLVSILSINDPFTLPFRQEDRDNCMRVKCNLEEKSFSDHFVFLRVFQNWNAYKSKNMFDDGFCEDNFVNAGTLARIEATRMKIVGYLRSVRLIQNVGSLSVLNEYSNNWSIVKACLLAGSYPEVARVIKDKAKICTGLDEKITINPGSVLRPTNVTKLSKENMSNFPSQWMIFEEKNLAGSLGMAKVCSLVSDMCIVLIAGNKLNIIDQLWNLNESEDMDSQVEVKVDNFIKFDVSKLTAYTLKEVREKFDVLMCRFLKNVSQFNFTENDEILIEGIVRLLELEDEIAGFKIDYKGIGARPRVLTRDHVFPRECQQAEVENSPCSASDQ